MRGMGRLSQWQTRIDRWQNGCLALHNYGFGSTSGQEVHADETWLTFISNFKYIVQPLAMIFWLVTESTDLFSEHTFLQVCIEEETSDVDQDPNLTATSADLSNATSDLADRSEDVFDTTSDLVERSGDVAVRTTRPMSGQWTIKIFSKIKILFKNSSNSRSLKCKWCQDFVTISFILWFLHYLRGSRYF